MTQEVYDEKIAEYNKLGQELGTAQRIYNQLEDYKKIISKIASMTSIEHLTVNCLTENMARTVQVSLNDDNWGQVKQIILKEYSEKYEWYKARFKEL